MEQSKHVHLIGIGGSGMSPLAHVLLGMGWKVSGSDLNESDITNKLRECGAVIYKGHDSKNITNPDIVVISAAIPQSNDEVKKSKERGIPVVKRIEMVQHLMKEKKSVAIAGTHGKTTTTSMVSLILEKCGIDPTVLIGGELDHIGGSAKLGKSPYIVTEADESDGQFLHLSPTMAVVTNIDNDHLDFYGDIDHVISAFTKFINNVSPDGVAIVCSDDANIRNVMQKCKVRAITYGIKAGARITAEDIQFKDFGSKYRLKYEGKNVEVVLNVPGEHNLLNSLAAIALANEIGISLTEAAKALFHFTGAHRRFEILGEVNQMMVVDDYAHHPTELQATIAAAKAGWENGRVIAVFQPHRYSRTKALGNGFAEALSKADVVFLTDIYAAGENKIPGVSGENIYQDLKLLNQSIAYYNPSLTNLAYSISKVATKGDLVLTLGAGNIRQVGEELMGLYKDSIMADGL